MSHSEVTYYLAGEGREFMQECIRLSAAACLRLSVRTMIIFTGTGEGLRFAASEILPQPPYEDLHLVGVTPPAGRAYKTNPGDPNSPMVRAGISPALRDELWDLDIELVSAHLPFKEIHNGRERSSEWSRVAEAYSVLGGGFALGIQAVLMACDAGAVQSGERVLAVTADTSFVAIACRTESFLSPTEGLLVEHFICRPMRYPVSKPSHGLVSQMWGTSMKESAQPLLEGSDLAALPAEISSDSDE
jgi:hypothetical protein